jgi:uncharacterized phage protein gp47/JayE
MSTTVPQTVPQIPVPPFVNPFIEDENTVRGRLLAAYPDGVSTELGTWARDFGEINVAEFVRQWTSLGQMLAQMFVSWATGAQLDAWALTYGIERGAGTPSYGYERFFAPEGTPIPPGTVLEVPQADPDAQRLRYSTVNPASMLATAAGYIDVPIQATDVGVIYDVDAGAITLLDSALPAVTSVQNMLPLVGGTDPQTDDALRQDVLEQAQLPVGSGTVNDYVVWGDDVPGVGDTAVYSQWDTSGTTPGLYDGRQNGSVLMVLRDPFNAPVDFSIVQATQQYVAPSRQVISMLESGEWALNTTPLNPPPAPAPTEAATGGTVAAGTYTVAVTYVTAGGETTPSPSGEVTTTGATSTITVPSPPAEAGVTGWYAYVTQAGGSSQTRQQTAGSPTAIGTNLTLTAPPTATGAAPPSSNTGTLSTNATLGTDTTNVQAGAASMLVTFSGTGVGTLDHARQIDLSRFQPTDLLIIWVRSANWSLVTNLQMVLLQDPNDYFAVSYASIADDGIATPHPTSGASWWQWRVQFSQLVKTGAANLAGIQTIRLIAAGSTGAAVDFDYWIARYLAGSTGEGGRAPAGADVTCIAPQPFPINVTITNSLLQDGYALVDTPGQTNALTLLSGTLSTFFGQLRPGLSVRFVDIAQVVHDTPGWIDFTLTLPQASGTPLAVPVALTQDAVLGTLTAS